MSHRTRARSRRYFQMKKPAKVAAAWWTHRLVRGGKQDAGWRDHAGGGLLFAMMTVLAHDAKQHVTPEVAQRFRRTMERQIIKTLREDWDARAFQDHYGSKKERYIWTHAGFFTDYAPGVELCNILEAAEVPAQAWSALPIKTRMFVYLHSVSAAEGYSAQDTTIWGRHPREDRS